MIYNCHVSVDQSNREMVKHGTTAFPVASYLDNLHEQDVQWHWHEELEAAVVTEGEAVVSIGTRTYIISKGDGFFVNSGVLHSCHPSGEAECCLHSLVFHPRLVGGSAESVFYQKYVLPVTENKFLEGYCLCHQEDWQGEALEAVKRGWQACEQAEANYELLVRNALSELLAVLLSATAGVQSEPDRKGLRDEERIKQMLGFIQEQYAGKLSTADIARSAAVSESECLRCFHAAIGTTPIQYLRNYRIQRAARMLSESRISVGDAATRCGFQDVSYFSKTFREIMGCTPKEYQNGALS